jgi:flavin reductase (DIM6/NTAB) family NADH-FMN oxidoreductase RutF
MFEQIADSQDALKQVFRRHASGVAVITLNDEQGNPVGFTATSVTSLGATPPLVSFNVARGSSTWPALSAAKFVALHTLGENGLALAQKMSQDHTKRFLDSDWKFDQKYQLPIFADATAVLFLKSRQIVEVEANAVVICDAVGGLLGEELPALLYNRRGYLIPGRRLTD